MSDFKRTDLEIQIRRDEIIEEAVSEAHDMTYVAEDVVRKLKREDYVILKVGTVPPWFSPDDRDERFRLYRNMSEEV